MSRMFASIAIGLALCGAGVAAQEPVPPPPEPMPVPTPTPTPEPTPMPTPEPTPTPTPMPAPSPYPNPQPGLPGQDRGNDANILAAVIAANEAEVGAADLALEKSQNADVRQFAQMMQRDHSRMRDEARALTRRITEAPEEIGGRRDMRRDAESDLRRLRGLSGAKFDSSYIASQVAAHEHVLQEIEREFLPKVKDAELRRMLETARTSVREHLEQARRLSTTDMPPTERLEPQTGTIPPASQYRIALRQP